MKPWLLLASLTLSATAEVDRDPAASSVIELAGYIEVEMRPLTGPKADVAALLLTGHDSGTLRAAVLASPRGSGATSWVDFWVEIEGASLLAGEPVADDGLAESELPPQPAAVPAEDFLRLELHAYAMTPEGELAGSLSRRLRLPVAELQHRLLTGGIKLAGGFELEPGEYQIRILVRELRSQRFVLRVLTVAVPSLETARPIILPPRFADVAGAWVLAHDATAVSARPAPPAALPVLFARHEQVMRLVGRGLTVPPFTLRLLDTERQDVADLEPLLSALPPVTAESRGHLQQAEARFDLPAGLATGTYVLEVAVSPEGGGSAILPVFVLDDAHVADSPAEGPSDDGPTIAWTGVSRLAARRARQPMEQVETSTQLAFDLPAKQRAPQRVRAIAGAYRAVLEQLAAGATEAAIDALQQLEKEVLSGEERHNAQGWLNAAQEGVIKRLAGKDADCLIPLLVLHIGAHDRYLEEGVIDPYILNATRRRILTLAETYADKAAGDMAPALAASALAELGVALDRAGLPEKSRRMLETALKLDQGNASVLLYLAYWHERRARYELAVPFLRRLLEVAPRSLEGRLRLALALSRWRTSGAPGADCASPAGADKERCDESKALLRQLLRDGGPEWLLAVAYQELGRLLAADGDFQAAARLLAAGVARLPGQQRLYLQLAYALERGGERRRAQEVAARLPADAGRTSPRHRYSQRPRLGDGHSQDALLRHATARLPLLARALVAVGEAS